MAKKDFSTPKPNGFSGRNDNVGANVNLKISLTNNSASHKTKSK